MKCEICGGEMGTGGCWTAYKHPPQVIHPLVEYVTIPPDGPGSHVWDLREMYAQRKRADEAEARAERAERQAEALAKAVELAGTFLACHDAFVLRQEPATAFAMKDAADALRAALAAYREGR